jgi:hypothetical protein
MFYRLQVIVNDLKGLREKVEDKDFSHKLLMCLPKKFATLIRMIFREGLDKVKPTDVLRDTMTDAQYNDDEYEIEEKKETKVKQEKLIAFKASSSKGKSKVESDDDDPFDDETMALLVHKMGRFMKKK